MTWLYFFRNKKPFENKIYSFIQLFLRPYIYNENNEMLVGEQVVAIDIYSLEKALEIKGKEKEMTKFYFETLNEKEYHIEYLPLSQHEQKLYLLKAIIYINNKSLTEDEALEWVNKLFILNNYPFESFKEGVYEHFADTNELIQMFSLENVKKFEDRLGKDWWKEKNDFEEEK